MIQVVRFLFALIFLEILSIFSMAQVSFCAVGDVLMDRGVRKIIEQNDVFYPFKNIKAIISSKDIAFYNNECPFAEISEGFAINKRFSFRAEPLSIDGIKYAGFNIASVANNHTIDYGKSAFLKTIKYLNKQSIYTVGGAENQQKAFEPLLIEKNGVTFAFFADLEFLLEGTTFNQNEAYPTFAQIDRLCAQIEKYNSIVDFVIVSFHWGKENVEIPTSKQTEYAHKVIDAGADLVIGQHPHVLQSIEIYRNKIILYSLGNFVFDNSQELEKQSAIFQCEFKDGNILNPDLIPIYIENNRPQIANKNKANEIFEHLKKVSVDFNTSLTFMNNIIKINYLYSKSVKEFKFKNLNFVISEKNISVFDDKFFNYSYQIPDTNFIFVDACFYQENNVVYIYSIVKNKINHKSQIAIFPFSIDNLEFLEPSIDNHDYFNPWKIDILDVDNDSIPEIILGVNKSTRYFKNIEKRIFVFNRNKDYIYPKWLGSKIGNQIVDFKVDELKQKLIILQKSSKPQFNEAYECKWTGFGFDLDNFLFYLDTIKNIKINFELSDYKFKTPAHF